MMDGKAVRQKLIGSDEERAVSPVIGVILMVAITVILAAVIAAFVLDMGQSQSAEVNAGMQWDEGSNSSGNAQVAATWASQGSADEVNLGGDYSSSELNKSSTGTTGTLASVGQTETITCHNNASGTYTITAIASADDIDGNTSIGTHELDCS